jgi:membrane fusion protein (multidrug efflux system)
MADNGPDHAPDNGAAPGNIEVGGGNKAARRTWLIRLAIAVVVIGTVWLLYYLLVGRNYVSTDDAYVNAEIAQVTPQSEGTVLRVHVTDTQFVKAGTVLVELDPATAEIGLAQANADIEAARRKYRQTVATGASLAAQETARGQEVVQAEAMLVSARADADKARGDLARREAVVGVGGVSGEELANARKSAIAAREAVNKAEAAVVQARATSVSAKGQRQANDALVRGVAEDNDPGVLAAKARLNNARIEMGHMVIRAPIDGVILRRQVQIGQQLAQGTQIMTIVPTAQVYIDANFKEKQLREVREGMVAEVTTDLYGSDVVYHGRVAGIGGGTGAATAIIPAQNATGNWIKVVQRLPVRIALDPKDLRDHPLRIGLSSDVTIDLKGH